MRIVRVYEEPRPEDGERVLVDRLWPRGLRRDVAGVDRWLKAVAPSAQLRRWYGHQPDRFEEFARRYERELLDGEHQEAVAELRGLAEHSTVTLLTATKDVRHSHAVVLARALERG